MVTELHLFDGITSNEISGLTITNNTTLESHVSACPGVNFTNSGAPDTYTIAAGSGTDCVDSTVSNYGTQVTGPIGTGVQFASVIPEPFLDEDFVDTIGINLSAHTPPIGGAWVQTVSAMNLIINTDPGVNRSSAGRSVYHNTATPPTANYSVKTHISGDAGWSDTVIYTIRHDPTTDTYYGVKFDPAGTVNLVKRIAGVETILQSAAFLMPILGTSKTVQITAFADNLDVAIQFASVLNQNDATITAAGFAGIDYTGAVGQPVHTLTTFTALKS